MIIKTICIQMKTHLFYLFWEMSYLVETHWQTIVYLKSIFLAFCYSHSFNNYCSYSKYLKRFSFCYHCFIKKSCSLLLFFFLLKSFYLSLSNFNRKNKQIYQGFKLFTAKELKLQQICWFLFMFSFHGFRPCFLLASFAVSCRFL